MPVGAAPTHLISWDFNRDGMSDLLTVNHESDSVSLRLGQDNGTFTDGRDYATGGVASHVGATGDFNGDGFGDIATANRSSNDVSILLGNGNGTFRAPTKIPVSAQPIGS